jgi:hypothetical protein
MSEALEILTISIELLVFYLRATYQIILRREFGHKALHPVAGPSWLESPSRWDTVTRFHAASLVLLIIHMILRCFVRF